MLSLGMGQEVGIHYLLCIPIRGNSVCILFISAWQTEIFKLNFAALIQVSIEYLWHPYTWNWKHLYMHNYAITRLRILYPRFMTWCRMVTYIKDTYWQMGSITDNIMNVTTWLFLEILSDVWIFTRNVNLYTI